MRISPMLLLFCAGLAAMPVAAAPAHYTIEADKSVVGFETDFGPDKINGKMPVTQADLTLDFKQVANTKISVTLDISHAQASFPFATQALKGPKVLDAVAFPNITFVSSAVRAKGDGAEVDGLLTIRGKSEPVTLQAQIYRQDGFQDGDYSQLSVLLTGAVNRSDFGATGWSDMVGDQVRLRILARIVMVR